MLPDQTPPRIESRSSSVELIENLKVLQSHLKNLEVNPTSRSTNRIALANYDIEELVDGVELLLNLRYADSAERGRREQLEPVTIQIKKNATDLDLYEQAERVLLKILKANRISEYGNSRSSTKLSAYDIIFVGDDEEVFTIDVVPVITTQDGDSCLPSSSSGGQLSARDRPSMFSDLPCDNSTFPSSTSEAVWLNNPDGTAFPQNAFVCEEQCSETNTNGFCPAFEAVEDALNELLGNPPSGLGDPLGTPLGGNCPVGMYWDGTYSNVDFDFYYPGPLEQNVSSNCGGYQYEICSCLSGDDLNCYICEFGDAILDANAGNNPNIILPPGAVIISVNMSTYSLVERPLGDSPVEIGMRFEYGVPVCVPLGVDPDIVTERAIDMDLDKWIN